jgi:hypothetical protein
MIGLDGDHTFKSNQGKVSDSIQWQLKFQVKIGLFRL